MSLDRTRIKGICFDVDGTLSDTDDAYVARLNRFFGAVRFLFSRGDPTRFSRWLVMASESPMNSLYHWLDKYSLDDNVARLFSKLSQRRKERVRNFLLMRGAAELLEELASRFPLTVVSARDEITTGRFLRQFGLERFFCAVVTSQTCEFTKPYPHPVIYAAERMGLPAANCVMIGDTTVDILAGQRAGAQTVGLLCGFGTEGELRRAGADVILPDLVELHNLFTGN